MRVFSCKSECGRCVVIGYSTERFRALTVQQAEALAMRLDRLYEVIDVLACIPDRDVVDGTAREIVGDLADDLRRCAREAAE